MLDSNKMSDDIFDEQMLADKLSKLNSSQQSIEFLSGWCIKHRKKARQIVESWDKQFKSAQRAQRVSFLYLSNDILQNSRRKGSEFVNEFWKVLPAALKNVYGTGDENGKKAASRLVDIWEERKVFGSRGQNLKNEMLGKNPSPAPAVASNGKNSNPIKVVKRDAHSLRIKLAAGALPEKIITSFQSVHDQNVDEEVAFNKFKTAILRAGEIERNVESVSTQGNLQGSHLIEDVQEQESVLQQCINQLESAEAARDALVSHLKDALRDQEPVLERIRTQLQVARGQLDQVVNLREKLTSPPVIIHNQQLETSRAGEANLSLPQPTNLPPAGSATSRTTEDENMKAAAAAVAAKLAASTSSAQMLTSVLSSLVAEEAASGGGSKSAGFSSGVSMFPPEKRPKLEKPMSASDANNSEASISSYFTSLQHQPMSNMSVGLSTSMQAMSQASHMQAPFPPPTAPPPPPGPHSNSPGNQFVQPASLMPYGYSSTSLPPPPPISSHISMGLARPAPPQMPMSSQMQSQQQNNGGYYRPPGIGFYGQSHQPTPPLPVPRQ